MKKLPEAKPRKKSATRRQTPNGGAGQAQASAQPLTGIIHGLQRYNRWRRGEDLPQPSPREIGALLEQACDALEKSQVRAQMLEHAMSYSAEGKTLLSKFIAVVKERDEARSVAVWATGRLNAHLDPKKYHGTASRLRTLYYRHTWLNCPEHYPEE